MRIKRSHQKTYPSLAHRKSSYFKKKSITTYFGSFFLNFEQL